MCGWSIIVGVVVMCCSVGALDNGLALTPPMGWLAWERFRCNVDCENDPYNCISESLFMTMADLLVSEGYADLGYKVVSLDDCWLAHERDADGKLQPDPVRFPSGLKALADFMHAKGLEFGMYEDYGTHTCAGYPGILGHLETDAQTFAEWGVDYVKLDGCYADPVDMDTGYPEFGQYLNATGRPMVYSCSWPDYQLASGMTPDWESIIKTCNLWRNFDDIQDSWVSVTSIIDYYGDNQDDINPNAGPGHWNDPDMKHQIEIWSKPINPTQGEDYSYAVAVLNQSDDGMPHDVAITLSNLGMTYTDGYKVTDLYTGVVLGDFGPDDEFHVKVNPTGGVVILRCDLITS